MWVDNAIPAKEIDNSGNKLYVTWDLDNNICTVFSLIFSLIFPNCGYDNKYLKSPCHTFCNPLIFKIPNAYQNKSNAVKDREVALTKIKHLVPFYHCSSLSDCPMVARINQVT